MMKKTALRVLSKLLPKSSDLDAFLQRDEDEALGVETRDAIAEQREAASGNLLDHFAETESAPAASPADQAAAPESAASGAGAPAPSQSAPTDSTAAHQPNPDHATAVGDGGANADAASPSTDTFAEEARKAVDPIEVTKRRGREAFRAGKKRRDLPSDLLGTDKAALAVAYVTGWDLEQSDSRGG
jgi:hypothetical protein